MARAGRKRKLKPREPSGRIKKTARDPVVWTRPPEEQAEKREAILGSRTKPGEIADPLTHLMNRTAPDSKGKLKPLLSVPQYEAAMAFRRAGHAFLDSIGYQHRRKCVLGSQQAQGAIRGLWHFNDGEWPERDRYTAALNSIRDGQQGNIAYAVCISEGYRFDGGDPSLYYTRTLEPLLKPLKGALNDLAKHYGYDKVARANSWLTDKPFSASIEDIHPRNRPLGWDAE